MKVKFEVTKEDIDIGIPGKGEACPIYRALKRRVPALSYVDNYHLWMLNKRSMTEGNASSLSQDMVRFVLRFDKGLNVVPQEFEVELPDDTEVI